MTKALLQQALEALENARGDVADWGAYASEYFQQKHDLARNLSRIDAEIAALRTAIAQAEQPVAWLHIQGDYMEAQPRPLDEHEVAHGWTEKPLYTHQQAAKSLNETQRNKLIDQAECLENIYNVHDLIRAVEAAHNIKEQQP